MRRENFDIAWCHSGDSGHFCACLPRDLLHKTRKSGGRGTDSRDQRHDQDYPLAADSGRTGAYRRRGADRRGRQERLRTEPSPASCSQIEWRRRTEMHKSYSVTENRLLEQARAGSSDAFSELVRMNSSSVYGISLKILKNREDAEDNLQNVFCKAYRKIHNFNGESRVSTWLFRIAINEALMQLRRRQSDREVCYSEATV